MKEFYHNKIGLNTAILYCENKNSSFNLYYHLYDNPVQHIWQEIHESNSELVTKIPSSASFESVYQKLNECCVNEGLDPLPKKITQEFLNWLHNEYVQSNKNSNWYIINDLIHVLESKLVNIFSEFDSSTKFHAKENKHVPLKEEYKIFLNTDIIWGRMTLGYGTLGKDYISIANNNDNLDDLSIQKTISSETQLFFCVEPGMPGLDEKRFYHWAKTSNFDVPLYNLNKLSLGKYPLGQLIITGSLLDYHGNANDWYVPNHICKLMWNKEVFTPDTVIKKISFQNTDLFYDSMVKHGNVKKIING